MRNIVRILFVLMMCLSVAQWVYAEEFQFGNFKSTQSIKSTAAGCGAPSGFRFLQVNNVRARINTGGDMWWDLPGGIGAQYFVPANSSATSLFSGSLWIGGLDINNQLKLAALRYRQVGQDYWTGPLTLDGTASIDEETCNAWDKFFVIKRADVDEYVQHTDPETGAFIPDPDYQIPQYFYEYPAHGDISKGQSYYLAPFKDADGDGAYDPTRGDYPYYDLTNELCPLNYAGDPTYVPTPTMESELYERYFGGILVDQVLKGDETMWWIFNDKGNIHTETDGAAIGMEIRAQAFGFSTNDEINNMTFYSYEIINRSTYELTQTYFAPWVDTDLGYAWDDYVGCDVLRGLGYCYNGLPTDEGGPEAYGDQPPAIGVDFFQGPYMDPDTCDNPSFRGDGLLGPSYDGSCEIVSHDGSEVQRNYGENNEFTGSFKVRAEAINGINFGNGIRDDERYGMRRFVYHNNSGGVQGDPGNAPEYYNYLRGIWKDGSTMLYGGNGHINSGATGPECQFMFPYDSDPCNWGTYGQPPNEGFNTNGKYWNEEFVGNAPSDRRFMQSAGPFTLKPGAVNYITVGIPWARATAGGPWESVVLLRTVDDKCQALFENCFKVIDGPDAPDMTFEELEKEIIVYISNSPTSNNYKEAYKELDPQVKAISNDYDPYFTFEGYQIFQLKDANVTVAESRYDIDKVRLVAQFDVKNGIGKIVNFKYDNNIGANVPVIEVEGGDNGIVHAFRITEDAFASGDNALINNKQYFYSAIAYGYNNYKDYDPTDPNALDGQKKPYLAGRKNIILYTAIPHKSINGIIMNSDFGEGPEITRIEGQGNGGMILDMTDATIDEILSKPPAYLIFDSIVTDTVTGLVDSVFKYNYGEDDYPISYTPTYKSGFGPVNVRVIDPLNVKSATYSIKFDTSWFRHTFYNVAEVPEVLQGGDTAGVNAVKKWWLIDNATGEIIDSSDVGTNVDYERLFTNLGISVTFSPVFYPGLYEVGKKINVTPDGTDTSGVNRIVADNNGLLTSSVEYADSSRRWLGGVSDFDEESSFNWIRSGTSAGDWRDQFAWWDDIEAYEKIASGTWAPYYLCAMHAEDENGPVYNTISKTKSKTLAGIASVDIVLTPDKSKWTRSPVIEMCADTFLAENHGKRFKLRKSASVDKNGIPADWPAAEDVSDNPDDPNYILAHGMGWFPGYAINLETGERLNIMFGEDSWLSGENGRDMIFNPSPNYVSIPTQNILFGGKHYVYVMASTEIHDTYASGITVDYSFPAYDAGKALAYSIDTIRKIYEPIYLPYIYTSAMYVGIPLSVTDKQWLSNEVKIKIRIAKPYESYYSSQLSTEGSQNMHFPMYQFSTEGISTTYYNEDKALSDLDLISVVPNPYYAYSKYELVPLDNRVKITNLPEKCTVSIYNISGTLIRKFTKDDPITFIDWDLKNQAGIPIAGGIYLVHVKDEISKEERIVKWFGSLRIEDFKQF